jgi:hypothetical protein
MDENNEEKVEEVEEVKKMNLVKLMNYQVKVMTQLKYLMKQLQHMQV